jgi:histidinol-phosphate aminotransferase
MNFERDNIRKMDGYAAGEQPEDEQTIKLNTNENPYPPSPKVDQTIKHLAGADLRRYPPPTALAFRSLAASIHNVGTENIIATRGGDELLRLLLTTFADPSDVITMSEPTYSLYKVLAQIQDCQILSIPLIDGRVLPADFADQANAAKAKLTFVVNPHAPSGHLTSAEKIRELASSLNSILLVDEAYVDFVDPQLGYNCIDMINEFDNLIFLRTLSKGYSLAGLRFGYGIGHASLIQPMMDKTRDSYNLDNFSQQIAHAALSDQAHARETWQKVRQERSRLSGLLSQLGLVSEPTETNFLLCQVQQWCDISAENIYLALKQNKVLVRYFSEPGLTDKIRITIGTAEENDQLIRTLREVLANN